MIDYEEVVEAIWRYDCPRIDIDEDIGISMVVQRGNGKSLRQLEIIDSLMKRRFNYENR